MCVVCVRLFWFGGSETWIICGYATQPIAPRANLGEAGLTEGGETTSPSPSPLPGRLTPSVAPFNPSQPGSDHPSDRSNSSCGNSPIPPVLQVI